MTATKTRPLALTVYKARDGYRWRATRGARIVAESGEAYTRHRDAKRALIRFIDAMADLAASGERWWE